MLRLDRGLRQASIPQATPIKFINLIVSYLLRRPDLTLSSLGRNKCPLARAIRDLISRYRKQARKDSYQQTLFSTEAKFEVNTDCIYSFSPNDYLAKPPLYNGSYKLKKHYYGIKSIEDMKASGEEFACARAINSLLQVKYWIRSLVCWKLGLFWLSLTHGKFYPDFIKN